MKSFSSNVKQELSKINNLANKQLVKAELLGYMITSSSNEFSTESSYNIGRFAKLLSNAGQDDYSISIKGNKYKIKTTKKVVIDDEIKSIEQEKALVRGTFLATGTISNPKTVYHLEIVFDEIENAKKIKEILDKNNINSNTIKRDNKFLVYIESGDNISKLLAFIGANKSTLDFEDARVIKDVRNKVNRIVNCETANLNKTIMSSVKQTEAIKLIKSKRKFNKLSAKEQELAELRIKNPNATLKELGEILEVSKSGINHRMNRIIKLAEEISGE